jgi:ribosomal protein S18 acetylase RimI-like enzyme
MAIPLATRSATRDDASAIVDVQRAAWAAAYGHLNPDLVAGLDPERTAANWARAADDPDVHVTVAVTADLVVGYASCGRPLDGTVDADVTGQLYAIYVHPDRQGLGAGRLLLAEALAALAGAGRRECLLWVARENPRARRFYERSGFALDEGASDEWRGIPIVCYRRLLP